MSCFGRLFKATTFGESHSTAVGCVVQGFPSNCIVDLQFIQNRLNRRRPGQSTITTSRVQKDKVQILSGVEKGRSLGSPITFLVKNQDVVVSDYSQFKNVPRPGHADFTYFQKYKIKAQSGGGRASARETVGRVCAGALAQQFLIRNFGCQFCSFVGQVGPLGLSQEQIKTLNARRVSSDQIQEALLKISDQQGEVFYKKQEQQYNKRGQIVLTNLDWQNAQSINVRCPDISLSIQIAQLITKIRNQGDSIGGIIISNVYRPPLGLGQPVFDKLPALLAHGMLSIPAVKGFEIGSGFRGSLMKGSEHNDEFEMTENGLRCKTNNSGGTLGGISNGSDIVKCQKELQDRFQASFNDKKTSELR